MEASGGSGRGGGSRLDGFESKSSLKVFLQEDEGKEEGKEEREERGGGGGGRGIGWGQRR